MADVIAELEKKIAQEKITAVDVVKAAVAVYLGKGPVEKLIGASYDRKDLAKDVLYTVGGFTAYRYLKKMGVFDGLKRQSEKLKEKIKEYK